MSEDCKDCEGCHSCPKNSEVQTELPKEPVQQLEDPTARFDVTRTARQEAKKAVEQVLDRASKGAKLDGKEIKKAVRGLYFLAHSHDELLLIFMRDLYRMAMHLAQDQMNLFALRTHLKSVVRGLEKKGLITEQELEEIHDKEVLMEELPKEAQEKLAESIKEVEQEETSSSSNTEALHDPVQSPTVDPSETA